MKKFLFSLLVGFVGLIGFGYCDTISVLSGTATSVSAGGSINFETGYCIQMNNTSTCPGLAQFYNNNGDFIRSGINGEYLYCFDFAGYYHNTRTNSSCSIYIYKSPFYGNNQECEECQECAEVDTGAILSGFCDINYCVENGLCPVSTGSRSELKINDIVHEGKPLINISIPDNIWWDFSSNENQFDLYVGSGYDQDYIDSVLKINSYRPDSEDFTQIFVSGLTLIFPYIFVALLIVFIWKLLKRVFK